MATLIRRCRKAGRCISEDVVWNIFSQIVLALDECHNKMKILHRDIKAENVFLNDSMIAKLGDFGLSRQISESGFARTIVGTPFYSMLAILI